MPFAMGITVSLQFSHSIQDVGRHASTALTSLSRPEGRSSPTRIPLRVVSAARSSGRAAGPGIRVEPMRTGITGMPR